MKFRLAATRTAAILGSGLALGGAAYAVAQGPGGGGGVGVTVPAGTISAYGGTGAPTGWLLANGGEVSRLEHPELFAAIGTAYGPGNGSTTFNLPDLRGRVAVGRGTHLEVDQLNDNDALPVGSRKIKHRHARGSLAVSVNNGGLHQHTAGERKFNGAAGTANAYLDIINSGGQPNGTSGDGTHSHGTTLSGEIGDATGPLDAPAYITINYIIRG